MAIPLLAPLAPLAPVLKIVALGSVKFIALGIGASVLPVHTANFLVGMSSSTPLKHAEYRYQKGYISQHDIEQAREVFRSLNQSITEEEQYLSRTESREFLFSVMKDTWVGMKQSIIALPARFQSAIGTAGVWVKKLLGLKSQ